MEAPGSTTFASLAMQMQMKILKNRQTSSTECLWSVAQLPYIASSHQYVFIARPGERTIEAAADDDDGGGDGGAAPRLKKGHWDVYVKLMKSAEKNQMTDVCFDTWVAKEESIVPVYNFYSLDAVWPLDSPRGLKVCAGRPDSVQARQEPRRAPRDARELQRGAGVVLGTQAVPRGPADGRGPRRAPRALRDD